MPSGKQVAVFLAHAAAATGVPGGDLLDIAAFVQLQHITHAAVGVPGGGVQLAFDVAAREELDGAAARSTTGKGCCCYREPWCGDFQCVDMPLIANEEGARGTCPTAHFDKGEFKKAHGWCQRMLGHGAVGRNVKVVQDLHPTSKVHARCGDKTGDSSSDYETELVNPDSPDLKLLGANLKSDISALVKDADKDRDKTLDKLEQKVAMTNVNYMLREEHHVKINTSSVIHSYSVKTSEFTSELVSRVEHLDGRLTSMSNKYTTGSSRDSTSGSDTNKGSSTSDLRFDSRLKSGSSTRGSDTNKGSSTSDSRFDREKYHYNTYNTNTPSVTGAYKRPDTRSSNVDSWGGSGAPKRDSGLAKYKNGPGTEIDRNINVRW